MFLTFIAHVSCTSKLKIGLKSKQNIIIQNMKKVNLKGKLDLKKEVMSKFDMNNVNGGASNPNTVCGQQSLLVICPLPSAYVNCTAITMEKFTCYFDCEPTGSGGTIGC
jgi:hypothetical protein